MDTFQYCVQKKKIDNLWMMCHNILDHSVKWNCKMYCGVWFVYLTHIYCTIYPRFFFPKTTFVEKIMIVF